MKDQRDDGGTYAIEDGGYRLQVAEIDIESAQCGDDDKVRKDEGPSTGPGAPESAAKIRNIDADLNCERPGQRLADRDGLAHLLLREPFAVIDQFTFHLSHERNRAAEAEKSQAQEVPHQLADLATWDCCSCRHVTIPVAPDRDSTGSPMLNGSGSGRSNLA